MMKKSCLVLFVFLFTLICSIASHAYTFTEDFDYGIYWKSFPINMKIYADSNSVWQELNTYTNQSVNAWENETGKNLWDISSTIHSGNPTGNYIKWSSNFSQETGYDSVSTLAVTIRYNNGSLFEKVLIILNAENSQLRQNFIGLLQKTILHELGHTIGLGHTDARAIMYPYSTNLSSLQSDDINGARDVISENEYRSATGYSANQYADEETIPGCGDFAFAGTSSPKQSYFNFIVTVLSTLVMILFFRFTVYFITFYVKEIPQIKTRR